MPTSENAVVEDGTGQQVLDELNELILAEVTKFSGTTAPADPEPYQANPDVKNLDLRAG